MSRIPESRMAKGSYVEIRDYTSRWRMMHLQLGQGDMDALGVYVRDSLAYDCEMAAMREAIDFAEEEGFLTPEMIQAGDAAIAWGKELRRLIVEKDGKVSD